MFEQTEYTLAYALVSAFVVLGMLVVCIPRPRRSELPDPARDASEKRLKAKQKVAKKAKKEAARRKKKSTKQIKKAKKS